MGTLDFHDFVELKSSFPFQKMTRIKEVCDCEVSPSPSPVDEVGFNFEDFAWGSNDLFFCRKGTR